MSTGPDRDFGQSDYPEIEYVVREVPQKRGPIARIGCGLALLVWFGVLLLPIVFMILAVDGRITIRHRGDVPEKASHPLFQVQLQMDADLRGLQFTRSSVQRVDDTQTCVQVDVSYIMWQGDGPAAQYCDCYQRETVDDGWQYVSTAQGACD